MSLKDAAVYARRSDRAINEDRQAGRLYALVLPGRERGFRYPLWQFQAEPQRLAAVRAPFVATGASCWAIHNCMRRPQESMPGRTPADWIVDPAAPIDAVVQLVEARYRDEQGAAPLCVRRNWSARYRWSFVRCLRFDACQSRIFSRTPPTGDRICSALAWPVVSEAASQATQPISLSGVIGRSRMRLPVA